MKLHDYFNLKPIFQIKYRSNFTRDVVFLEFGSKGKIVRKLLSSFNNKVGIAILAVSLKLLKRTFFRFLLTYPPEEFPDPDISYAIKNFEKA